MAVAATTAAPDALETALAERARHFLASCVFENARFLAERLVAHRRSDDNVLLLATCLHRAGRVSQAVAVLEGATQSQSRYLLAVCCFQLGRLAAAENALVGGGGDSFDGGPASAQIPNGAAGLYLMGRICRRANRREQAIECFVKSLEADATLWTAYEELCELGADVDASRFFGAATYLNTDGSEDSDKALDANERDGGSDTDDYTASSNNTTSEAPFDDAFATPEPRPLMELRAPKASEARSVDALSRRNAARPPSHSSSLRTPSAGTSHPTDAVKKLRVGGVASGVSAPTLRPRKTHRRPLAENDEPFRSNTPVMTTPTTRKRKPTSRNAGSQQLLRLLSSFGAIYRKMSMYMCREALSMLEHLPAAQRASGWVQHQIGRAHFEMAEYNQALDVFKAMHRAEPHRMAGVDLYSTTLWHLKKEVEISYLAQQVTEFDKLSSEAWCVAGNCFSLQKEHDTALSFFQRAIQLDPSFTYAYTLSGHEYVANEDFEKAINCYRHAIRTDPRHYNAWYGLGTIYYRQEKFEFAEYHFRRALEINPRSSLLHCFLGMVLHSTRRFDEALRVLAIAGELQPLNPQARFQRANVLITQHRYEEALAELKVVRNFAPRESSVHFMMGKVAKKLGRPDDAMRFFTTALYFHPKDNNVIKSAIDKINEPDLDDDDRL